MDLKLGMKIAAFRKAKEMTQEQLAQALGVSAPAVSKWETGSSYPDITMLCPLARTLGTDVDTLLEYEEALSDEKAGEYTNLIIETLREEGVEAAEHKLQDLLHQYPNSVVLKYYAVTLLTTFEMYPPCSDERKERWKRQKEKLLWEVYAGGMTAYFQPALSLLVSMAIADGKLDKAEQLLKELPEPHGDSTFLWVNLYLKREEPEKAKEIIQRHLYNLIGQVQACLTMMTHEKLEPDVERAIEICGIYQQVEEIFGYGGTMSDGLIAEIYQRAGEEEKMLQSLVRFVNQLVEPVLPPSPLLFSPTIGFEKKRYVTKELRQVALHSLLTEEIFVGVRGDGRFQQAVEKLRNTLECDGKEYLPTV